MPNAVVHPEARLETLEARDYYDGERDGYGLLFVEAVDRDIALLLEYPRVGKRVEGRIRRHVMRSWPYSIVYLPTKTGIIVYAVAHQKRRPGYWRKRLQ